MGNVLSKKFDALLLIASQEPTKEIARALSGGCTGMLSVFRMYLVKYVGNGTQNPLVF
jgi:hypothetical protein